MKKMMKLCVVVAAMAMMLSLFACGEAPQEKKEEAPAPKAEAPA